MPYYKNLAKEIMNTPADDVENILGVAELSSAEIEIVQDHIADLIFKECAKVVK